ncbi:MAG: YncE family protein [Phycisphaerae bacterium]
MFPHSRNDIAVQRGLFQFPMSPAWAFIVVFSLCSTSWAASIHDYAEIRTFMLPASWNGTGDNDDNVQFEPLPDGRLLILNGSEVSVETGVQSGTFSSLGTVGGGFAPTFGASFLVVSPDGTRAAAGTNGEGSIVVFDTIDPSNVDVFVAADFDAIWLDNQYLAISNFNGVEVLDTNDGSVLSLITNVGGASAGITIDSSGRLFTGNGFDFNPGGSETGSVKAFERTLWEPVLSGGASIDFESQGTEVVDLLGAASLGFDSTGNLFVGGGDFFGGSGDFGYAAFVDHVAWTNRLLNPSTTSVIVPSSSSTILRQFASPPDTVTNQQPPRWKYNKATNELYLGYFEFSEVFVYGAEPDPWADVVVYEHNGVPQTFGPFHASPQWSNPEAIVGKLNTLDRDDTGSETFREIHMAWAAWFKGSNDPSLTGQPYDEALGSNNGTGLTSGSQIVVRFDEPILNNPNDGGAFNWGIDFIVHGNAFFLGQQGTTNPETNMENYQIVAGGPVFSEPVTVSVAQTLDGPWYTFSSPTADGYFPTQPWVWNISIQDWSSQELDWTKPVNPNLVGSDFGGLSVTDAIDLYAGSAGGTGFDIEESGFDWIQYVRVSDPSGLQGEITGIVDVAEGAPANIPTVSQWGFTVMLLLILTTGTIVHVRRLSEQQAGCA